MVNLKILLISLISLVVFSCEKPSNRSENLGTAPIANFSATQTNITAGTSIDFTDLSTENPKSWSWSFAGGMPSTSTSQNPVGIQYATVGTYVVTLTATNAIGSDVETKTGYIVVSATTAPQLPVLSTIAVSSITNTTAISGGNIISQGSSAVATKGICWNTSPNPSIANSRTTDGIGIGTYSSNMTGLVASTTYYIRAYASNTVGIAYGNQVTFTTSGTSPGCGNVTDIDGNVYHSITIGTQCWMVENLKTTRYKDGTAIPTGLSNSAWNSTTTGAYAIYNNDTANNTKYGKLYNWYAVHTGKLAPAGWHVPTDAEWTTLSIFLGGTNVAGGKMKSTSTLWRSPNTAATNSSGFTGLPGGYRYYDGTYSSINDVGEFWTNTENGITAAWNRYVKYNDAGIGSLYNNFKQDGYSIRCIKD